MLHTVNVLSNGHVVLWFGESLSCFTEEGRTGIKDMVDEDGEK